MDVKELNKSQLILLTLLLSFVTSIATGITTVTLMQQAPQSIIQPINRIVRQTVEKIAPEVGKPTVQTVIIKEEDLVVDAIAKNRSAIFNITKEVTDVDGKLNEVPVGRGFAVTKDGTIVADALLVPDKQVYYLKNDSGKFKAEFISTNTAGFSFLKLGASLDEKNKASFTPPDVGDLSTMKEGQKLLVLGNSISSIIFDGSKDVKLSVSSTNAGSPVVNLDGEAIGIALSGSDISFASITAIMEALKPAITAVTAPKVQ